jgi:hypothetical protein
MKIKLELGEIISERNYHGYTIKKARKVPFGIVFAVYKNDDLVIWDTNEKRAEIAADWDAQYNN